MAHSLQSRLSRFLIILSVLAVTAIGLAAVWAVTEDVRNGETRSLNAYIDERGQREDQHFNRVAEIQEAASASFWTYYNNLSDEDVASGLATFFPVQADGTRRSIDPLYDGVYLDGIGGVRGIGAYFSVHHDWTDERKKTLFAAFLTIARHSAALSEELESLWFFTDTDDLIIFAPTRTDNLEFYRKTAPADFAISSQPLAETSSFENNPDGITKCTPLTDIAYIQDGEALTTGCQTPIREGRNQLGVFGTTLPMSNAFREAVTDLPAKSALLFFVNNSGNLIAHRDFLETERINREMVAALEAEHGTYSLIEGFEDHALKHDVVLTQPDNMFSGLTAYYHLEIPDWYLVIQIPFSTLLTSSLRHVMPTFLLAIAIALVCVGGLVAYVRLFGIKPLHSLAAHFGTSSGTTVSLADSAEIEELKKRPDEIGELARRLVDYQARKEADLAELEHKVDERTSELQQVSHAKSTFLATMSHEMRTPMNGIIGVVGALKRTDLADDQTEMVDLIQRSASVLERQLSDILDLSKVEAGKLELDRRPFNIRECVERLGQFHRHQAEAKGLYLTVSCDEACDDFFMIDEVRVKQVLNNLITNAIKYTKTGGITVQAQAECLEGRHYTVRFDVADTGCGIEPEFVDQIFEPFAQLSTNDRRQTHGSGLGLTITKSLVELQDGELLVQSKAGEGSTFTVILPLTQCATNRPTNDDVQEAPTEPQKELTKGTRILLAEDHTVNRRVVQLILRPFGIDIVVAENGQEAVDAFQNDAFDLILMDVRMPVLDGLQATAEIRRIEAENKLRHTPIVVLSANAMPQDEKASLDAGADMHLRKPITPETLITAVKSALHQAREPDLELPSAANV